jgi:hypothetical protein
MPQDYEIRLGPIEGLSLPSSTWKVLRRENITTLDQLRVVADRIELFEGIWSETAQVVRAELARVTTLDAPPFDRGQLYSPWSA